MPRPSRIAGPVGALLMILMTGCSAGTHQHAVRVPDPPDRGSGTVRPALPSPSTAPIAGDPSLPIDSYLPSVVEQATISEARDLAIGACMRAAGFAFDAGDALADAARATAAAVSDNGVHGNLRRYGIATVELAAHFGYHLPSMASGQQPSGSATHGLGALDATALATLNGGPGGRGPAGGCVQQADRLLRTSTAEPALVARISDQSYRQSLQAPEVVSAFARWSSCMRGHGYHYTDPTAAGANFDIAAPTVSRAETVAALADVGCKRSTGVVTAWSTEEIRFQEAQISAHRSELTAIRIANIKQLDTARALLAQPH